MKKNENILTLLILLVILSGCTFSNCVKIRMSSSDKDWINSLALGDSLTYVCQETGVIDTFVIDYSASSFTACNKFEFGRFQYEKARLNAQWINSGERNSNCGFSLNLSKERQKDSLQEVRKTFNVFDFTTKVIRNFDNSIITDSIYVPFYQEKVICHSFNQEMTIKRSKSCSRSIRSFDWNKEFGLLGYTLGTGERYALCSIF